MAGFACILEVILRFSGQRISVPWKALGTCKTGLQKGQPFPLLPERCKALFTQDHCGRTDTMKKDDMYRVKSCLSLSFVQNSWSELMVSIEPERVNATSQYQCLEEASIILPSATAPFCSWIYLTHPYTVHVHTIWLKVNRFLNTRW